MKKSYLWAFCWASSMGFAQQGDSISIALQQVSIHIQQSEKNKAGSVIHHQEVFQTSSKTNHLTLLTLK